jgi:glutaredoxin
MNKVTIYTGDNCAYCTMAKHLLAYDRQGKL